MTISSVGSGSSGAVITPIPQQAPGAEGTAAHEAAESAAEKSSEGDVPTVLPAAGPGKGTNVDTSA